MHGLQMALNFAEDRCTYIPNRTNQLRLGHSRAYGPVSRQHALCHILGNLAVVIANVVHARLLFSLHLRRINDSRRHADAGVHQGQLNIIKEPLVGSVPLKSPQFQILAF